MRKKYSRNGSNGSDESSGGGWEIVYTGFVLILLCFFIMLSSFATMEEAKVMQFVRSFAKAVSIFPGGLKFEPGQAVLPESADVVKFKDELAKVSEDLEILIQQTELEDQISLSFSREGLVMQLSEQALFDSGMANLSPEAVPLLQKIGEIIKTTAYDVRIEGHTDNVPIHTQKYPSNWELSTARAVSVLRYFVETHKVSPLRLSAEGFGEHQPLDSNDTAEGRARNRRVEIIFINKDSGKELLEAEG